MNKFEFGVDADLSHYLNGGMDINIMASMA